MVLISSSERNLLTKAEEAWGHAARAAFAARDALVYDRINLGFAETAHRPAFTGLRSIYGGSAVLRRDFESIDREADTLTNQSNAACATCPRFVPP